MPKINKNMLFTALATAAGLYAYKKYVSPTVRTKLIGGTNNG